MGERERGFDYELSEEVLRDYQKKPLELRLQWLYMGNLLRRHLPERTRRLHDLFREKDAPTSSAD